MVDLSINIGKLKLKNPVMNASGTFGDEYAMLVDIRKMGAIVAKTITLNARAGNPPPRLAETPSGMLNSIGLENGGLDYFIKEKLPRLTKFNIPVIASISSENTEDLKRMVKELAATKQIAGIEINLSCPNLHKGQEIGVKGQEKQGLVAQDEEATFEMINAARSSLDITLIAKLTPNVTSIVRIAKKCEEAGADAVIIANTFPAMAIDIGTRKPKLGNVTGGLSGPAIKPIILKMVWDTYNEIDIPIIASGGVMNYQDAVEFILCGATAIQIGTATFVNPKSTTDIVDGLKSYMSKNQIKDIASLTGSLKLA